MGHMTTTDGTQQTHTTLYDAGNQLPNVLMLWHFIDIPHHECMNSSCKNANTTYDGYREFATRVGHPRIKGNQTSPTLLREMNKPPSLRVVQESKWTQVAPTILRKMNKLFLFAVIKVYHKGYYLPRGTHARQPTLEIIAMLYCWPCPLQQVFLHGHSTKQTPDILAMAATKYSLITSRKWKYPQTPCIQAHPITCTTTGGEGYWHKAYQMLMWDSSHGGYWILPNASKGEQPP